MITSRMVPACQVAGGGAARGRRAGPGAPANATWAAGAARAGYRDLGMRVMLSSWASVPLYRSMSIGESPVCQKDQFDHGLGTVGLLTP